MKNTSLFLKKYLPKPAIIMFIIALICAVIHLFAIIFSGFADFFNRTVAAFFRLVLAKLTGWLPISFAEIAIICLPLIIGIIVFFAIKAFKKGKENGLRYLCGFFAVITLFYSSFILTFACGYRAQPIEKKLALERKSVTAEELEYTTIIVMQKLNELANETEYGKDGFSDMPYSYKELNKKLNAAYKSFAEEHTIIQNMSSKVKPIILSEPMTYTHISGVYTFFTGEANVNTNYPEYNLPYTMAHEMAHQRGIAPENEANFVAFLVCLESGDTYIQYSAYLNMFEYLTDALYSADKERYMSVIEELSDNVLNELIAYSDFFDKYRDNVAADISGTVNNSYLTSQGQTAGTRSYGLVVDLAVAYYRQKG